MVPKHLNEERKPGEFDTHRKEKQKKLTNLRKMDGETNALKTKKNHKVLLSAKKLKHEESHDCTMFLEDVGRERRCIIIFEKKIFGLKIIKVMVLFFLSKIESYILDI